MSLTYDQIKKAVGANILLYDAVALTWKTNRDVTETDVGNLVQQIYQELFPLFASHYPSDYRQSAIANSWIATGVANAGLNSTTLTTTTSIFTNSMAIQKLTLWNDTDSSTAKVVTYTSGTSIVTDTDMTSWSGDTIYVLGQEFAFGGDATDIYHIDSVAVKYNSTDQYYRTATQRSKTDFFQDGSELAIQASPMYYPTTISVNGTPTSGIGILPAFTTKISNAIQVDYIARPGTLATNDTLHIPADQPVINGATMLAYMMMQDENSAEVWAAMYERSKREAIARYTPTFAGEPVRPRLDRRAGAIHNRSI